MNDIFLIFLNLIKNLLERQRISFLISIVLVFIFSFVLFLFFAVACQKNLSLFYVIFVSSLLSFFMSLLAATYFYPWRIFSKNSNDD